MCEDEWCEGEDEWVYTKQVSTVTLDNCTFQAGYDINVIQMEYKNICMYA